MTDLSGEIFKIQRPLSSSIGAPQYLVYNEDRSVLFEAPAKAAHHLFKHGELKIYVEGSYRSGELIGAVRVPNQDW